MPWSYWSMQAKPRTALALLTAICEVFACTRISALLSANARRHGVGMDAKLAASMAHAILTTPMCVSVIRAGPQLIATSNVRALVPLMQMMCANAPLSPVDEANHARSLDARQQTRLGTVQTTVTASQLPRSASAILAGLESGKQDQCWLNGIFDPLLVCSCHLTDCPGVNGSCSNRGFCNASAVGQPSCQNCTTSYGSLNDILDELPNVCLNNCGPIFRSWL